MAQPQYALSWDSYKTNICSGFSTLQQNGEFVDMTIAADGHLVKVHQVLIALASPFLKELIASAPCQHPVIFLNNVSHKVLSHLLEYIYTGEVIVPTENLLGFMEAAKSLHIKGLESIGDDQSLVGNDENVYSVVSHHTPEPTPKIKEVRGAKRKASTSLESLDASMEEQPDTEEEFEEPQSYELVLTCNEDEIEEPQSPELVLTCTADEIEEPKSPELALKSTVRLQEDFNEIETFVVTDAFSEITPYKGDSRWFSRNDQYYVVHRSRRDSLYLRCASLNCPVQWILHAGKPGPIKGEHNHDPTPWVPIRNAMFQSLKKRAIKEDTPLRDIYHEEAAKFKEAVPYLLYSNVIPSMRKWRRNAQEE